MGKKEFLSELEKSLSVLQEDELRDIISEYEQHIDIKVEKGLTEEEAIADFGGLEELAGEILEAYHVRVDYASRPGKNRKRAGKIMDQESGENLERLKAMGERGSLTLWRLLKGAGVWLRSLFRWSWRQVCRPFVWLRFRTVSRDHDTEMTDESREGSPAEGTEDSLMQNGAEGRMIEDSSEMGTTQRRKKTAKAAGKSIMRDSAGVAGKGCYVLWRAFRRLMQWGMEAVLWVAHLAWNGCWILFSLLAGGFGLFSLFGLGVLSVLLMQGYPLVGVTVGCAGLVCCMFSAAGLGMSLLWLKDGRREDGERKTERKGKEQPQESRRRVHRPERLMKTEERDLDGKICEKEAQSRKEDGQDA